MGSKSLSELAQMVNGEIIGDGALMIHGVADIDHAKKGELTFLAKNKKTHLLDNTDADAVLVAEKMAHSPIAHIVVADPNLAFAILHNYFLKKEFLASGISDKAVIGKECQVAKEVSIGPLCVLGNRVSIGSRVTLHPGVVIGNDVSIGDDTTIFGNVVVYDRCVIGARVTVHGGAVIGSDGFGYATDRQGNHVKRPHVGSVRIDDDVELGANVCIDRGTFGVTHIRAGVKIDNLVQVAHNVDIGENTLLVAQVGIAGSTSLGRNVVLGGQVGIAGHLNLGDRTMVGAQSGVHNNQQPGSTVSGTPAIPHQKWLRASLAVEKIPDLIKDVRKLKKSIESSQKDQDAE